MATLTKVTADDVSHYLRDYAEPFDLAALEGIPAGSVNSNYGITLRSAAGPRRLFLRIYEEQDFAGARFESEMLVTLASRDVPCVAAIERRDGARVGTLAGKPAALFPWRDGTMRCQASVSETDAWKVGEAIARIHLAGSGIAVGAHRFGHAPLVARLARIAHAPDPELSRQAEVLRPRLDEAEAARRELPSGLVHGDLFRDNVLWTSTAEGSDIATLLDFESAFRGPFLYDLAVAMLAWCFGDTLREDLARAMLGGYAAVRPLDAPEREAFPAECRFAALRFTITRITDYAMRTDESGPRVVKDWRRFATRYETVVREPSLFARLFASP